MKTTDFINTYAQEGVDPSEYNDEAPMIKNDLHTIVRVATHLNKALGEHENLPTWVIEKLAQTKGMLVSVMDYMISQHEMGQKDEIPGFDVAQVEQMFESAMAETTGDKPFDNMIKNISKGTKKQATADRQEQKAQNKEQARAAFGNMFGGGNLADKLKIKEQGVEEAATDDPKFQKMMGNIQKNTPDPFGGYVAVSYASEKPSKKIRGATVNGKALPATTDDPGRLMKDLKFTSDRIEQQLMAIGQKYGWDLIEPGQGQGYSELYFDTNREYTTDTQRQLATNIVKTVNEINKFFASMNSSLQATGLPGYRVNVWQGMGANGNINQFDDINQITNIAKGKSAKSDPGPAIGKMILKYLPGYEAENDELGYDPKAFTVAKAIASTYITKGEREGLQAQISADHNLSVSDMIDELLSDHGGHRLRTISSDDLDETVSIMQEDASAGASGASSIAVTMETLGQKGGFSKSDVHKKITGYSNMQTRGGPVKVKNNG
jgi:hypothetical protein